MEGCLNRCKAEGCKFADLGHKAQVVTIKSGQWNKIEMTAIETEMMKAEKATGHAISFVVVRVRVKSRHWALAEDDLSLSD